MQILSEARQYVREFLASQPSPEEVIQFRSTDAMQERASALLETNRNGELTSAEINELDEYIQIDHLVTMLKAQALSDMNA